MKPAKFFIPFPSSLFSVAFFLYLSFGQLVAQDFGGFKPGIKWQQINTPAIRVIFPKGLESQANRVANNILYLNQNSRTSIGPISKKIDLILNNQGVISNGYVTLMPFRSEFYTTPMQDGYSIGTTPWLDLLSVHEYRHAMQYTNLLQGFPKIAWWLFGDSGWGTLINLTTPAWFFEGDAVATETALTNLGRGRMPSFFQQYKAILLSDKRYTYMKARNGSFRDIVPNEYELGYLLCSYGREKFGNNLWQQVLYRTAWMNGIIYPFSDAVMVKTGMGTPKFYRTALADYKAKWAVELQHTDTTVVTPISQPSDVVTDYKFPVCLTNGDILVYERSYEQIGSIYRVAPDGYEEKICTPGIIQDPYFTANENLIAWSEVSWNPRYSSTSYSDIVLYQIDQGKKKYLTHKQRYFSPALSPDGSRMVVAEVDSAGNCQLKILDSHSGEIINTLANPDGLFYTYPKWDVDGNSIISSARTTIGSMLIIKQLISDGSYTKLTSEYNQVIGEVFVTAESILFTSGFSGINNIYSLARSDGKISQLTGSKFGAYNPTINTVQKSLVYCDFGLKGYSLVSAPMSSLLWKTVDPDKSNSSHTFDFDYFKTEGGNIFDKVPDQKSEVTPYRQLLHPVRVHSWSIQPGFYSAGINLTSDNTLNNIHLQGGFKYYYNENAPGIDAQIQYGGLYPILSAGVSRYYRHADFLSVLEGTESTDPTSIDNTLSVGVEVPLDLSKGTFYKQANLKLGYDFISVEHFLSGYDSPGTFSKVSAVSGRASFSATKKRAYQNLSTPLGMKIELSANQSIAFIKAKQYQALGDFAIRGLFPNHNLIITAGWKYEPHNSGYHFMDLFLYPRGYSTPDYDQMFTLQSSYHFPIFYPDFGFLGIFYCSRVRATIFADYGYSTRPKGLDGPMYENLTSFGSEIILDTRWFNIAEIPMGVRFSLLLSPGMADEGRKIAWEFVMPILRL